MNRIEFDNKMKNGQTFGNLYVGPCVQSELDTIKVQACMIDVVVCLMKK